MRHFSQVLRINYNMVGGKCTGRRFEGIFQGFSIAGTTGRNTPKPLQKTQLI